MSLLESPRQTRPELAEFLAVAPPMIHPDLAEEYPDASGPRELLTQFLTDRGDAVKLLRAYHNSIGSLTEIDRDDIVDQVTAKSRGLLVASEAFKFQINSAGTAYENAHGADFFFEHKEKGPVLKGFYFTLFAFDNKVGLETILLDDSSKRPFHNMKPIDQVRMLKNFALSRQRRFHEEIHPFGYAAVAEEFGSGMRILRFTPHPGREIKDIPLSPIPKPVHLV